MKSFSLFLLEAMLVCPFLLVAGATSSDSNDSSVVDSSVALTRDTFDEKTVHKSVFVKFFAPWCSHCAELQPAWEQLAVEFKNHDVALVASVDCSANQNLCEDFNIQGLPTLLYGDASHGGSYLHEYRGNKSYTALSQFAKEHLTTLFCSPANVEACEPEMRKQIQTILQLDKQQLEQAIQEAQDDIHQAEVDFQEEFQKMQTLYDQVAADHSSNEARIKAKIQMIQAVLQTK